MNYCIYNGINSNTIAGLVIQELPPITKPQVRTEITEIEGKDGDIVDILGYASYDKILSIGLTSNANVDQIINYFKDSGDLTLSNESDKIYKAAIYESIDFERLVKFRTAKVKFHVQPFKYLLGELPVELEITSEMESNNSDSVTSVGVNPTTNSGTNYFAVSTGKNLPISNNASKSSGSTANTEINSSAKEINFAKSAEINPSANVTSLTVTNVGLEKSKPIITLWGSGVVEILINGLSIFQIDFGLDEYLTVDSEIEECYKDETLTLKNRQMTGEFPTLEVGASVITRVGTLTKIVVEVRSRWL